MGFRLCAGKRSSGMSNMENLGFFVDTGDQRRDPANTEANQKTSLPTNLPILRTLLEMISHYSSYFPELHRIGMPPSSLLNKNVTFSKADTLTRLSESQAAEDHDTRIAAVIIELDVNLILSEAVRALSGRGEVIKNDQTRLNFVTGFEIPPYD
ncbi:hypothetical protein PHET_09916 [Paragonimus heterotremus]|uniref:Uncharacterized protein n=1 Tax=Paragonimus heterotremus TaxID=100268 RepID=A0A8J4SLT0_9TREM|nr:hypothetical protein PHET_09916 [Paragonimus heterotremus]